MFWSKRIKWVLTIGIVIFVLALLSVNECGHRNFRRCVLCRLIHVKHYYCGFHWEEYRENSCSEWYRRNGNFSASPDHLWIRCGTSWTGQNLFGQDIGCGCSVSYGDTERLTPDEQKAVYEHIEDIAEATQLFVALRDDLITGKHSTAKWRTDSLSKWCEEDEFKTPWPEWKRKMDADIETRLQQKDQRDNDVKVIEGSRAKP